MWLLCLVCALALEPLGNLGFQGLSLELWGKAWFLYLTWSAPTFYIISREPLIHKMWSPPAP